LSYLRCAAQRDSLQMTADARLAKVPIARWFTRQSAAARAQKQAESVRRATPAQVNFTWLPTAHDSDGARTFLQPSASARVARRAASPLSAWRPLRPLRRWATPRLMHVLCRMAGGCPSQAPSGAAHLETAQELRASFAARCAQDGWQVTGRHNGRNGPVHELDEHAQELCYSEQAGDWVATAARRQARGDRSSCTPRRLLPGDGFQEYFRASVARSGGAVDESSPGRRVRSGRVGGAEAVGAVRVGAGAARPEDSRSEESDRREGVASDARSAQSNGRGLRGAGEAAAAAAAAAAVRVRASRASCATLSWCPLQRGLRREMSEM
jgi:hypothetical protein